MRCQIFATLFFSVFVAVTGVGVVVPLLPVYAKNLGASGLYISLIFGSFSISRSLLLPFFGRLSDKKGRKPLIVTGLFAYFLISLGFMVAPDVPSLILARFIHGIASAMVMPVSQAYIGDITPRGKEGFYMGMFNMSLFASLSIGPLAGGFLNARFGLSWAFASMAILALTGCVASVLFLPPLASENPREKSRGNYAWSTIYKDRVLVGLLFYRFVYTCGIAMIWCFLPVLADTRFQIPSDRIGILVMAGIFVSGILNTPMGWIADRWHRPAMVLAGGVLVALGMWGIGQAQGFYSLLATTSLFGMGGGISVPAMTAISVEKGSQKQAMGGVMSMMTMAHSLGMLAGSLAAGLTMDYLHLNTAFPLGAATMVAGLVVTAICTGWRENRSPVT